MKQVIKSTTNAILGTNAYDNQIEYLKTTKKPKKLSADEWMRRIQNINLHLVNMEEDAQMLTDKEIIKEIIILNIPIGIKYQVKIQGGSSLSWNRIKELLTNMFALMNWEHNKKNNHQNNQERRRNNGAGRGRGYNNEHNNNSNYNNQQNQGKEETYQQRREPSRTEADSYYSEDDEREESNMMRARMKCRNREKENNEQEKLKSCTIIVSVKTEEGHKNVLALDNSGSSATLANKELVEICIKNKKEKKAEWATQGGTFKTTHVSTVQGLKLLQFTRNRMIDHELHLFKKKMTDTILFLGEIYY